MESFPGKILIVDDDPDLLSIYSKVLKKAGYEVDTAKDGTQGYAKIMQGGYDVVLLDVVMVDIDGLTILKRLYEKKKESQQTQSSDSFVYNGPIIILSQVDQPQIIQSAYDYGAKGYILKSNIDPNRLPDKISEILRSPDPKIS